MDLSSGGADNLLQKLFECQGYLQTLERLIHEGSLLEAITALEQVKLYLQHVGVPSVIKEREKWHNRIRSMNNGVDPADASICPPLSPGSSDDQSNSPCSRSSEEEQLKDLETMFHHAICALLLLLRILTKFENTDINKNSASETSPTAGPKQMLQETRSLINKLTANSLLIENFPPQVLKTEGKFKTSVRLAVGTAMGLQLIKPSVKCVLLNESQLLKFKNQGGEQLEEYIWNLPTSDKEKSGILRNSMGCLDTFSGSTTSLSLTLNNMRVTKINRSTDRSRCALEEKFCLLFHTNFTVKVQDQIISLSAFAESLPAVVVVHDLQKCSAEGPVLWDNAFYLSERIGFDTRQDVTWRELAFHLQHKFIQLTSSGQKFRALTPGQLAYLAKMLFSTVTNTVQLPPGGYDDQKVTYEMVFKQNLPGFTFGFWEWFWNAARTIREDIRDEWIEGLVLGFAPRGEVERMLSTANVGTFVIRFVESKPGCVCLHHIAFRDGKFIVKHPQPYTRAELGQKSLALRIRDSPALSQLYPNLSKTNTFAKHWVREEEKYRKKNPLIPGFEDREGLG